MGLGIRIYGRTKLYKQRPSHDGCTPARFLAIEHFWFYHCIYARLPNPGRPHNTFIEDMKIDCDVLSANGITVITFLDDHTVHVNPPR